MSWYRWLGDELELQLRIQPKASRNEFISPHGDEFKLRITAPPVDGKANAHLLKMLAKAFGVSKKQVLLIAGESSRSKRVRIKNPQTLPIPVKRPTS